MVIRISVAWTTVRRSSARVSWSRVNPSSRDHRPMYIEGAYCAWSAADALERARERSGRALEQQLAGEHGPVEV